MTVRNKDADGWLVSDVGGLARRVPEVDPAKYFDEQAKEAYEDALVKWPVLAKLMGLVDASTEEAK